MVRQRFLPVIGVLLLVGAFLRLETSNDTASSPNTLSYRGETIQLSKPYRDYESYQNDRNNIAPEDVAKVQQLVKTASIARRFPSQKRLIQAVFDLKFPGYGLGSYGETPQPDGSVLALFGVEIPKSGTSRYLLFRGREGTYTLIDDFVHESEAGIACVSRREDQLVYATLQGAEVLTRAPSIQEL